VIRLSRRTALVSLLATTLVLPHSRRLLAGAVPEGLLLVDGSLDVADLKATPELTGVRRTVTIEADLVCQWRDGLGGKIAAQSGPVTALLRWDKALLLSGLAREEGIPVTSVRLSRSLFRVDLNRTV
jgi:hypothetical protein